MSWNLYEVWGDDTNQNQLLGTTNSLKEANQIAEQALEDGMTFVTIYRETDDGDLEVIKDLTK